VEFEWDPKKATQNVEKHQVSFREAATVFGDPISTTFPDPDHSLGESRYLILGVSSRGRLLVVAQAERGAAYVSLVQERQRSMRGLAVKSEADNEIDDDLRSEYDVSQLTEGVRGKYTERYRAGTNLVLLDPDVAQLFPDDESVNEALRALAKIALRSAKA